MLPRLQAEEQLAGVRVAALGGGLVEKDEAGRRLRAMEAIARGDGGGKPRPRKATPADLAKMGIGAGSGDV